MHRRIWLLVGAAAAVLLLATSATAMTKSAKSQASHATASALRSPAARKAHSVVTIAMEQDLPGTFNINYQPSNSAWTINVVNPVLTPVFGNNAKLQYVPELATKVVANSKGVTYYINPKAVWNWGGKKVPVTYKDFVYTWKMILNPKNSVVSTQGVNQLASYTHKGLKQITFYWKTAKHHPTLPASWETPKCTTDAPCGPFADYRDIFGAIYPGFALRGMAFNTMWAKGIVGSNGKFVTDGPFYITNYTKGQHVIEKANPLWWGRKQGLKELDFVLYTDTNSEIQAIKTNQVDIANPQPQTSLASLIGQKGLNYRVATGLYDEHIDLQEGPDVKNPRVPLLRAPWFRQAIMMSLDRQGLINALYKQIAPGIKPSDNLIFFPSDAAYRADFAKWNYNPQKAINLLKAHGCTGGPSKPTAGNTSYFTCAGLPAKFGYRTASDNARRTTSATIFQANLAAVGINAFPDLLPTATMFDDAHLTAGNYDVMEFAWGGVLDPGSGNQIWSCNGSQNYLHYCNAQVTKLLSQTNTQLNPEKRTAEFQAADKIMANDVPAIPLYDLPEIVTFRAGITGVEDVATGFTWNTADWRWKG